MPNRWLVYVVTERITHVKTSSRGCLERTGVQKVLSKQLDDFVSRLDWKRRFPVQQHSTHSCFTRTQIPACITGSGTFNGCFWLLDRNQHNSHCVLTAKVSELHNMFNMIISLPTTTRLSKSKIIYRCYVDQDRPATFQSKLEGSEDAHGA